MKTTRVIRSALVAGASLLVLSLVRRSFASEEEAGSVPEEVIVVEGSRAPRSSSDPEATVGVIEGEPLR